MSQSRNRAQPAPVTPLETYMAGLAAAGSAGMLSAAFMFQYVLGMAPCEMCVWQRWPHAVAVLLGLLLLVPALREARVLRWIGVLTMLVGAGLALLHTGVEQGWWQGPTECSGAPAGQMTTEQLMQSIMSAPLIRCDQVAWEMLGLSMASWNGIFCLVLAGLWAVSIRRA